MTASEPEVHAIGVLADRIAAALVHREPGWRLPRRSALARRYNVSMSEIDAAIRDLARRSLIRRLPDGQLYRASPADYWIPLQSVTGVGTRVDPMGSPVECHSRHVSIREAQQDIAWAIGVAPGAIVRMIRSVWMVATEPAAVVTTYLPNPNPNPDPNPDPDPDPVGAEADTGYQDTEIGRIGWLGQAKAVSVELCPPQPAAARSLRLTPGQPVITVTSRFEDESTGMPAGLTVVLLRPELFRVTIDAESVIA